MIEFYFMESAVNCSRPLELTQRQCRHGVTSQPFWVGPTVLSGPLHDFLHDCWQCFAIYPLRFPPSGGVLPIMAYTGRLRPKGVPFCSWMLTSMSLVGSPMALAHSLDSD